MGWNISSTHGCFCRACVRQGLDSFCQCIQKKSIIPRRQARAVAPVVPRRSVRDCYKEPDQTREPRGPSPSGGKTPASLLSLEHPARLCRAVRGQGVLPLARAVAPVVPRRSVRDCYREPDQPASREARRRAAVILRPACFPASRPAPFGAVWGAGHRPARPASREARRRAAVKPRPACFPSSTLRGCAVQSGVKGGERKRVPSGHNRRRRLATGSRQPKRGFGTAVPKTTIEVADHYPLFSRRWPARRRCTRRRPSDRSRRPLPYRSLC